LIYHETRRAAVFSGTHFNVIITLTYPTLPLYLTITFIVSTANAVSQSPFISAVPDYGIDILGICLCLRGLV